MASQQLFYTYTSGQGLESESKAAIANNDNYDYSVSFDVNRKSIWAGKNEYGVPRMSTDNILNVNTIQQGISTLGYMGSTVWQYVNEHGTISLYETCKITSFTCLNRQEEPIYDLNLPIQEITSAEHIFKFMWTYNGTSVKDIGKLEIYKNKYAHANVLYRADVNLPDMEFRLRDTDFHYTGESGDVIYAMLTISDKTFDISDSTSIKLVSFKDYFYYLVSKLRPAITSATGKQIEPIVDEVIPPVSSPNNTYFWIFIPNIYSFRFEQGGGESDLVLDNTTATLNGVTYKIYRTPRKNVCGALYRIRFNKNQ